MILLLLYLTRDSITFSIIYVCH